eukprot:GHVU01079819.1.p2 GENE.GHVU01079819.1~~GHVU01079819.1.p2  ORF type:complete len:121 (+),score=12.76 GHVU01079819.1:48-365(+)
MPKGVDACVCVCVCVHVRCCWLDLVGCLLPALGLPTCRQEQQDTCSSSGGATGRVTGSSSGATGRGTRSSDDSFFMGAAVVPPRGRYECGDCSIYLYIRFINPSI